MLDGKSEDCDVVLLISYVITEASWTPKYDIRVYSDSKTLTVTNIQFWMLFGIILMTLLNEIDKLLWYDMSKNG